MIFLKDEISNANILNFERDTYRKDNEYKEK